MAKEAAMMGLNFVETMTTPPRELFGPLPLFRTSGNQGLSHVLKGEGQGKVSLYLFDYQYSPHPNMSVNQTVAAFHLQGAKLPHFVLHAKLRERLSGRGIIQLGRQLGDRLSGYKKIGFPEEEAFTDRYKIRSPDSAEEIRGLFDEALRHYFSDQPGWHLEGRWEWLILYQYDRLVKPKDLKTFVYQCQEILAQFRDRSGSAV